MAEDEISSADVFDLNQRINEINRRIHDLIRQREQLSRQLDSWRGLEAFLRATSIEDRATPFDELTMKQQDALLRAWVTANGN